MGIPFKRLFVGFISSFALLVGMTSCTGESTKPAADPEMVSIDISGGSNELIINDTLRLNAIVTPDIETEEYLPASQEVVWSSSSNAIASIDEEGNLTAVGVGNVTITATAKNTNIKDEVSFVVYEDADERDMPKKDSIPDAYNDYLKRHTVVFDEVIGAEVDVSVYSKLDTEGEDLPVAVYVINHQNERVGGKSDIYCMYKLLKEYVVVVIDYQNSPLAVSPKLEESAHKFNYQVSQGEFLADINFNSTKTYLIPSGCLIKRDVVYYELMKSAPKGFQERTVDIWNRSETETKVTSAGGRYARANELSDIIMKNGDSITTQNQDGRYPYLEYKMDIVYPVSPIKEVPLILGASSSAEKNYSRLNSNTERYLSAGFMLNGYAWAGYDHEYLPFQLGDYGWGHIEPIYSLQGYLGNRSHTAAVRCAKYYADELGYSKNLVGVYGHSKSSWCSLLSDQVLTSTNPDDLTENNVYPGYQQKETYGPQPYQFYKDGSRINADITCIYHSMGEGTNRAKKYVKADLVPTMVGVGEKCQYNSWEKFYQTTGDYCVYKYFVAANPNFIDLPMYGVGHTYPYNRDDILYQYNYYDAMTSFFRYYLQDGDVRLFYTASGVKHKITSNDDIFIQFNCPVDSDSVNQNCFVKNFNSGNVVPGTWSTLRQGNRWVFNPSEPLINNEQYIIEVTTDVVDLKGKHLVEGIEDLFTFEQIVDPGDDDYQMIEGTVKADALASTDDVDRKYGSSEVLRIFRSDNGATSRISYIKFNLAELISDAQYEELAAKDGTQIKIEFYVTAGYQSVANTFSLTTKFVTPVDQDWDESTLTWSTTKSTGQYSFLGQASATAVANTVTFSDTDSPSVGKMSVTIDFDLFKNYINTNTGDIYGDVTIIFLSNDNTIRLASKDNTTYDGPRIWFMYPKE